MCSMLTCRRTDGSPLPDGSVVQDNVLIFPSPVPADSGDYICFFESASFTYSLLVEHPPTTSPLPVDPGGQWRIWHPLSSMHDCLVLCVLPLLALD